MQIREQGRKVQLIRSIYNSESKKCDQKLIGTLAKYDDYELSMQPGFELRDDEQQQVDKWLSDECIKDEETKRLAYIYWAVDGILSAAAAIEVEPELLGADVAYQIHRAVDNLLKVMRKAGFKRPVPAKVRSKAQTEDQATEEQLLAGDTSTSNEPPSDEVQIQKSALSDAWLEGLV